jgi:outer membrane protein assembly factor BamA
MKKYLILFILILLPGFLHAQQNKNILNSKKVITEEELCRSDTVTQKLKTKSRSWSIGAFPIFFYTDETKLAGGAGIQIVYPGKSERHSSAIGVIGFYTQNKQYIFQISPEIYLKDELYKFSGNFGYANFPDKFYGIGNNTKKTDEEDYTSRLFNFRPVLQRKIFSNLYAGIQYDYARAKLTKLETGKLLHSGTIPGSEGGIVSGIGINVTWDSRNNNLYPSSGSYHQFSAVSYEPALGSDFTFNSYILDLRHYKSIFDQHILAVQGVIAVSTGNPPFQILNQLGAFLRGYYQSRFEDRNLVAFQIEYRMPLFWRFGLAGFAGFGEVSHEFNNISLKELKPSTGFGIRFALIPEQKVNLRIDFGFGKDDSSFDITINELF